LSVEQERAYRAWGCELVAEMCVLLSLPPVVAATGQTLLHRFYYRRSLTDFDVHVVAMAVVFLAAKVEENPRRMRDVLNVLYRIKLHRQGKAKRSLVLGGVLYFTWKQALIRTERLVLKDLGFSMYTVMEHPHKFILYYVAALGGGTELAQHAWDAVNDSLRLDLCVRYHAQAIACAAIHIASRRIGHPLPHTSPWWEVFDTTRADMLAICEETLALYDHPTTIFPPQPWPPSLKPDAKPGDDDEEGEVVLPPIFLAIASAPGAGSSTAADSTAPAGGST